MGDATDLERVTWPAVLCEAADCWRTRRGRGPYCNKHRQRMSKHGDPNHERYAEPRIRFLSFVKTSLDGCWVWQGGILSGTGYGQFWMNGSNMPAHRASYLLLVGPIPEGLELDHLCRNRPCVRPDHLDPVTHAENMARGAHAIKTHCKHGHEFTSANTYRPKRGERVCRICANRRSAKRKGE